MEDKDYEYLSRFKAKFATAIEANWVSTPSPVELRTMVEIYKKITGRKDNIRTSCGHCILRFMQDIGRLWMAEDVARAKAQKIASRKRKTKKKSNDTETTD